MNPSWANIKTEPCTLFIRNNATGEIRALAWEWPGAEVGEYVWRGGNFGCNCNRAMFFADAAGEDEPDVECGDGAFSVRLSANGIELYADDDWD